jgi:hypothetical protein
MRPFTLSGILIALAAIAAAQQQRTVAGTVTAFRSLELGITTDAGDTAFVKFGPDTQVVTVTPGERDLAKAKTAAVVDIVVGDRVMATFVPGLTPARRIVLITGRDIAQRNEAERQDWKARGISGIVTSVEGNTILLEVRTPEGAHPVTVKVDAKTRIRRYAPGSTRFADALPATTAEIAKGDQLQSRGNAVAEDVVFGTFLTKLGTIRAVNREAAEIRVEEAVTKTPLTIRLAPGSQVKLMGAMRASEHGGGSEPAGRFDLQRLIEGMPAGTIADLKVGGGVIVTSTKGAKSDELTAILVLGNADMFVQMAQGPGGMGALGQLHGGMLGGAAGLSLPTMIQ